MDIIGKHGQIETLAQIANCLNLVSFFLAWWVVFTPLVIWQVSHQGRLFTRIGTGPHVVSAATAMHDCTSSRGCIGHGKFGTHWLYWDELSSNNVCVNGPIYDLWAKPYGFCNKIGGTFDRGPYIRAIQAFAILTLIFSLFAVCSGCSVRASGSKGMNFGACCSFLTWLSAVIGFSLMITNKNEWYTDLRSSDGTYIPFETENGTLVLQPARDYNFGPSFGMLVTIFILSLCAHCMLQAGAFKIDKELKETKKEEYERSESGDFGAGNESNGNTLAQA